MSPIVYIGNTCIGLSIGLALFGALAFLVARRTDSSGAASLGRGAAYGSFVLMTVANLAMVYALLGDDFGVSYVAHVGSRETPRWISAISLWSSLEGSILFWGWLLTAYAAACLYLYRERKEKLFDWVGLTLHLVGLFFFFVLAIPANPFLPVAMPPSNGPGPNPLLQNHWLMAVHPPCLYMGYIGFTVPFAFAIAALLEEDVSGIWVTLTRRWTLFAWAFLSIAIVLGGWWSYAVLGWGGYWAWDPVENASFMPWLAGTALVHSVMVQEKRRLLAIWNLALAIITFLLTVLGTFLTRSGVLDSVHSFTESHIGPYFLFFIAVTLGAGAALLLWKGPKFREKGRFENLFSLEVLFLFNNLLFISFCFIVFLGTLYPLVVEAISGTRISVGEPYFNQMTVPIFGMILLLMGISLVTPWKKGNLPSFIRSLKGPAVIGLLPVVLCLVFGVRRLWLVLMIYLASVAWLVMKIEFLRVVWKRSEKRPLRLLTSSWRLFSENPRRYGGFVAHAGALLIAIAIGFSQAYEKETEVTLKKGESVTIGGYTLTLAALRAEEVPQRFEIKADVSIRKGGAEIGTLSPQMNYYPTSKEPIGSPAIRSTLIEDLYLTLIHFEKDGSAAALKVIVTPAVVWIWVGGVVVMLGGFVALSFGRSKKREEE